MPPFGVDLSNAEFSKPEESTATTEATTESPSGSPEGANPAVSTEASASEAPLFSEEELAQLRGEARQEAPQPTQVNANKQFDDNFSYDIAALVKNPELFEKFASIYPQAYVEKARQILAQYGVATSKAQDPRIDQLMQFYNQFQEQQKQVRIEAIGQKIDSAFEKMTSKYPDANPNLVNWYLQGLSQRGIDLMDKSGNLRTNIIEKLFKQSHDEANQAYQKKYKSMVDSQKKANFKAKDMGAGGSPSSAKANSPRTIKEATNAWIADVRAR